VTEPIAALQAAVSEAARNAPRPSRGSGMILIVDDDETIAEALAVSLSDRGLNIIICSDVEAAELVLQRFDISDVIADVQFSRALGFEGIRMLERVKKLRPSCRMVVMTGYPSDIVRAAALAHGAVAFLSKPFDSAELLAALRMEPGVVDGVPPGQVIRIPGIDALIRGLRPAFQPIVRLGGTDLGPVGYEALARFGDQWPLETAEALFEYAAQRGHLYELNEACIQRSLRLSRQLPPEARVFINVDPPVVCVPTFVSMIRSAARKAETALNRVVLELTESAPFPDEAEAGHALEVLRKEGVAFALDDAGIAYSHLPLIGSIEPSFLKISHRFGTGFEIDATKRRLVGSIVALGAELGCQVVLEGVESSATAAAARDLGIAFAQGFWFGMPQPVERYSAGAVFEPGAPPA
jgi:EAL domain-containing protein (putative c-di-GMP-specific phosphodiesterase class I)